MPRVKLGRNQANEEIVALLWGKAAALGMDHSQMAEAAHMSRDTLRRRKKNPESLTLGELRRLGRALDISIDALRPAIRYF